jgi:A/G-specific adenine glycosylase
VLAFAHDEAVGVLDVNVVRALSRLLGRPATQPDADALARSAASLPGGAWTWNQAVMELGARACRPRPRCDLCPVAARCGWRAAGPDAPDPWVRARPQSRFQGSDRQGRGRLVDALRRAAVAEADLATVMGWPADPDRAARVAATLVPDGLAARDESGTWRLP